MDTTINQPQSQAPDARHSLGVITTLMKQRMEAQQPQIQQEQAPQMQEAAPQQEKPQETDKPQGKGLEDKVELNMTDKLEELRKEMKDDMQREMDGIKTMIQQALTEENGQDETTKTA